MAEKYSFSVDVDNVAAIRKLQAVAVEARQVGSANQEAAKKASGAWETFKGVLGAGAVIGAFQAIASAASSAFGTILESTKTTERIKTELQVMTGSVEAAEAAYTNLQAFAATTPFQIEGIADAARSLIAFGFDAETVTDKLRFIGDVASGSGSSLQDLTQIFGQVAAAGQLTGERFNQLAERAVPIGRAIAETMGVTEASVKQLVSEGRVSFKDFEKAFQSLAAEGGIFFDGMNKKSQTLEGTLSTLSDTFDLAASDIGNAFLPAIKEAVVAISDTTLANRELIKAFAQRIGESFTEFFRTAVDLGKQFYDFVQNNREALAFIATALGVAAAGWAAYAAAVTAAAAAQAAVAAFNPIILGLGAVVVAVTAAIRYWDELKLAFFDTVASIASLASAIPGLGDKMGKLAESARNEAAEIRQAAEFKKLDEGATAALTATKEDAAARSVEARRKESDGKAQINADELKKEQEHAKALEKIKLDQRAREEEIRLLENEQDLLNSDARFQKLVEDLGREEGIKAEARLRALEAEKQTTETRRAQEQLREEIQVAALERQAENQKRANDGLLSLDAEFNQKLTEQQKAAEADARKRRDGELLYFKNQKDREAEWAEKTERQKLDVVRGGFSTLSQLSRDGNKELGEIGRGAAIAGATIDTYKAATSAYAALAGIPVVGPALGAAAAAAAVVAGLANVREIKAQRFERGGIVAGSSFTGDNVVARVNSGELILNRAQQRNLAPQLMGPDMAEVVVELRNLRQDVRSLQLTIGDEDVFNAVNRQVQAGRQL